jgi:hypothetical protein
MRAMSNADVVGYYERSKLWNEQCPLPHTLTLRLMANYALGLDAAKIARPDHLRIAEIGALPGREATTVLGGDIFYHIEDETAGEGVQFHDILASPLDNKYGVLVAGLVLQEFQTVDDLQLAVANMCESADTLVISCFNALLWGAWGNEFEDLPPTMPIDSWRISDIIGDNGYKRVSRSSVEWTADGAWLLDNYLPHARNELVIQEHQELISDISFEIWSKNDNQ